MPDFVSPRIDHLLIIAGPSGSGKSTFVRELTLGGLPNQIMSKLPSKVDKWMQVGKEKRHSHPSLESVLEGGRIPAAIVHYDMTRGAIIKGHRFYRSDPPLVTPIRLAKKITILTLRPSPKILMSQLIGREFALGHVALDHKLVMLAAALGPVGSLLLSFICRLGRSQLSWTIVKDRLDNLRRYKQKDWIDDMYRRWDSALGELINEGNEIEHIYLEPDPNPGGSPPYRWRLRTSL